MSVRVELGRSSYDVLIGRGLLHKAGELLELDRKVLVVTDSGVPAEYAETIAACCAQARIVTVPQGEQSKCFANLEMLCREMLDFSMTRSDCVAAVGGGVVGDLAGFAASVFMRGIDFYNIPTTVLSQVDSSVGGKTAIDMGGIKNCIGAFHQPKRVIIDPEVLKTLPPRQVSNGLAEALKMAATFDEELFCCFERGEALEKIDWVIHRSVELKARVVEQDEKEKDLRRVLNFGHTVGHAIESREGLGGLLHGECVALGMLAMCSDSLRRRLEKIYEWLSLPAALRYDADELWEHMLHDKKKSGGSFNIIYVENAGSFVQKKVSEEEMYSLLKGALEE